MEKFEPKEISPKDANGKENKNVGNEYSFTRFNKQKAEEDREKIKELNEKSKKLIELSKKLVEESGEKKKESGDLST